MSDFPLPVVWNAPFEWPCFLWDAPLVRGDEVIARAGARLVGLAQSDGRERWRVELGSATQGGEVLGAVDDVMFVDSALPDRSVQLVGARRDGVMWRVGLGGRFVRRGAAVIGGEIVAVVSNAENRAELVRIDPASGLSRRMPLATSGATIAAYGEWPVVFSPTAQPDAPGAYIPDGSGAVERVLRNGDVWYGGIAGGRMLTVGGRDNEAYVAELADVGTGAVQWSAAGVFGAGDLDDRDAAYAERTGATSALVLRDAATGTIRWRTDLGDAEPGAIAFAGPLVLVRHMIGLTIVRRDDGQLVGDVIGSYSFGGAVAEGRLFLGHDRELICARLLG